MKDHKISSYVIIVANGRLQEFMESQTKVAMNSCNDNVNPWTYEGYRVNLRGIDVLYYA